MESDLAKFIHQHTPLVEESASWGQGLLPLRIISYLSAKMPPLEYITSVRTVVFQDNSVLVVRDSETSFKVTPGGRIEAGETLETTLRREVLEETGWGIINESPLGFMHFQHLAPKLKDYPYPHPDFIQLIYVAEASDFTPEAQVPGEYELESGFRSITEAQSLELEASQQLFLEAALRQRHKRGAGGEGQP